MNEDLKHHVCFNKGTEPAFTGKYLNHKKNGIYTCVMCEQELFISSTKFDSGTGWPSFYDAIQDNIETEIDTSHGMTRVEVHCKNCKAHLGHVFKGEGFTKKNVRHCVNSLSLEFETRDSVEKKKK